MKELKKQLVGIDKEALVVLLSALILMCLFPYQGHPNFFIKHFSNQVSGDINFWSQVYRFFFTLGIFFCIPVIFQPLHQEEHPLIQLLLS